MDKETAQFLLRGILAVTIEGFKLTSEPSFRLRGSDVVCGSVVEGKFRNIPACFEIIFLEEESGQQEATIPQALSGYQCGPVRTPLVLAKGGCSGYTWTVTEKVFGEHLIGDSYPKTNRAKKLEMAKAFWLMNENWPQLLEEQRLPRDHDPLLWFSDKINQWTEIGARYEIFDRGLLLTREILRGYGRIREITNSIDFNMRFTHSHFCDKELRKDAQGIYWLTDFGATSWRPELYDAAFCVWHILMHSWSLSQKKFLDEVQEWENAFVGTTVKDARNRVRPKFRACMIERCVGAICADIAEKRGIVATLSQKDGDKLLANWRRLLEWLVS